MHTDEYNRHWQGQFPFNKDSIDRNVPRKLMGVYQVLYTGGPAPQVVYIGIATGETIHGRLTKHVTGKGNELLKRIGDPTKFIFVYFECDATTAKQIESHVVTTKKPPFNTRPEYRDFIPSISVH